jgi:hypothetical protein
VIEPGLGVTATEALRSEAVGDHRGLVFVDTLDQTPPRADNQGTLVLDADYMEGVFVINAGIRFAPAGAGKTLLVSSPMHEGRSSEEPPGPIQLTGIHVRGALVTPGSLALQSEARLYGAVAVGGSIAQASGMGAHLEVWYDADFRKGLFQGVPLIYQALGTRLEKYGTRGT